MSRVAVEIARALPCFEDASEFDVGWACSGGHTIAKAGDLFNLSLGERAVAQWARATEHLLDRCDAETVDRVLETVDRIRAGMVR